MQWELGGKTVGGAVSLPKYRSASKETYEGERVAPKVARGGRRREAVTRSELRWTAIRWSAEVLRSSPRSSEAVTRVASD